MKTKITLCVLLAAAVTAFAEESATANKPETPYSPAAVNPTNTAPRWPALKTEKEKISYSIGVDMAGLHLMHRDILDKERMIQGFRDAFDGQKPMLDYEEAKDLLDRFEKQVRELEKQQQVEEGVKNRRLGAKFMEEKKKEPGVKQLPSGLMYKVVTEGKGAKPTLDDRIRFHYLVKNVNGDVVDDSHRLQKGVPASMRSLMPGWREGLQMMTEGSTYVFYVPSELAYGENGAGRTIKPHDTLETTVELLSIEKQ